MLLLRISKYLGLVSVVILSNCVFAAGDYRVWFDSPATSWNQDALPVGNGRIGAMVFGSTTAEQIQFTEETLWTGQPHDYSNLGASNYLRQLQAYIFATNQTDFWSLASQKFMSVPLRQCAFQPGGTLELAFPHKDPSNYVRGLDLETAIVTVEYTYAGVRYVRRVFASYPDNILVVRCEANSPGKVSFTAKLTTPHAMCTNSFEGNDLVLDAGISKAANGLNSKVWFRTRVRFILEGGSLIKGDKTVTVTNANAVTILLVVGSNFVSFEDVSGDPVGRTTEFLRAVEGVSYARLLERHLADYQPLFRRVTVDFGFTWKTNLPTGARIKRVIEGDDPGLFALYLQFARYLMISGSRPGCHPLTLQGKWNNVTNPSWEGKMTLNINQQMNYWIVEPANLSECHAPMFDLVKDLMISGARIARNHYNARGWVVHHNTDLWRGAAPINGRDGLWPTGSAWLCQHLWEHFLYTGDTNFLIKTAYPAMKSAAEFYLDFLVEHPGYPGWFVTCPSYSPEHDHPVFGPNVAGPTMDNELIRALFKSILEAGRIVGEDESFLRAVSNMLLKLPPLQIGRYGQLQEWLEDVDRPNDTHRHCSHLVGLYPGDSISLFDTPELAMAAKVSVDWRGYIFGDKGWAKSWRACLRARLGDGETAYLHLTNLIAQNLSSNMMFTDIPNRQVDGTFGAAAAMIEMILQSHRGEIHLLPALPRAWTNGIVRGLRARGGFEVDIVWTNHKLSEARITSLWGTTCCVRSKWPIEVRHGNEYLYVEMVKPGVWKFPTTPGKVYVVEPAVVYEVEHSAIVKAEGGSTLVITNAAFSNQRGLRLSASDLAASFTLGFTNLPPGDYTVVLGINRTRQGGRFQVGIGLDPGVTNRLPGVLNAHCATGFVYVLPTILFTETNRFDFWTNMLEEVELVPIRIPSNAVLYLKFWPEGLTGSTNYDLELDYVRLHPVVRRPKITAALDRSGYILSWPEHARFWQLKHSTNLLSEVWQACLVPVTMVGGECRLVIEPSMPPVFYRLDSIP